VSHIVFIKKETQVAKSTRNNYVKNQTHCPEFRNSLVTEGVTLMTDTAKKTKTIKRNKSLRHFASSDVVKFRIKLTTTRKYLRCK